MSELEISVHVELFVLADAVQVLPDGRVNMLGAVPEHWTATLDQPSVLTAALVLSTETVHAQAEIPFGLRLVSEELGELHRELAVVSPPERDASVYVEGARVNRTVPIQVQVEFRSVGPHRLELFDPASDAALAVAGFSVRIL